MCTVLHAMMIMTDTDVLEAEVMKEGGQEVGPLITTIEDLIVLESKCDTAQWSVKKALCLLAFFFLPFLYTSSYMHCMLHWD